MIACVFASSRQKSRQSLDKARVATRCAAPIKPALTVATVERLRSVIRSPMHSTCVARQSPPRLLRSFIVRRRRRQSRQAISFHEKTLPCEDSAGAHDMLILVPIRLIVRIRHPASSRGPRGGGKTQDLNVSDILAKRSHSPFPRNVSVNSSHPRQRPPSAGMAGDLDIGSFRRRGSTITPQLMAQEISFAAQIPEYRCQKLIFPEVPPTHSESQHTRVCVQRCPHTHTHSAPDTRRNRIR